MSISRWWARWTRWSIRWKRTSIGPRTCRPARWRWACTRTRNTWTRVPSRTSTEVTSTQRPRRTSSSRSCTWTRSPRSPITTGPLTSTTTSCTTSRALGAWWAVEEGRRGRRPRNRRTWASSTRGPSRARRAPAPRPPRRRPAPGLACRPIIRARCKPGAYSAPRWASTAATRRRPRLPTNPSDDRSLSSSDPIERSSDPSSRSNRPDF